MFESKVSKLTGCAWHTLATSSAAAPYSCANTASLISSPPPCYKCIIKVSHTYQNIYILTPLRKESRLQVTTK